MARPKAGSKDISARRIIDTALQIVGEAGVSNLTIGEVARRLQVRPPSIYWYFPSKDELITAIAQSLFAKSVAMLGDLSGLSLLFELGRAMRRTLLEAPNASAVIAISGQHSSHLIVETAQRACGPDLDERAAVERIVAIMSFTLGFAIFEANPDIRRSMALVVDIEHCFDDALNAIVRAERAPKLH